jgi:hypothetical protein
VIKKAAFFQELGQVFHNFARYHIKILLRYFNAKVGERIFSNPQLGMRVYIRMVMKSLIMYTPHPTMFWFIKSRRFN